MRCTMRPSDNDIAYNNRAWSYHLAGRDALGLPDANRAVALAPKDADSIATRAEIYEKLGKRDYAIADYRQALSLAPELAQEGLKRLGTGAGASPKPRLLALCKGGAGLLYARRVACDP
jgi:tetratricopeptide (TPR) repeat protein